MSKYNTQATERNKTTNLAGGEAFVQTPELEFVSFLLTSFVKDQFYQKEEKVPTRVTGLLGKLQPDFAAKAAIYARNTFNMRSISHVVAAELAAYAKGKPWAKSFYEKVVVRPDDITEILSYYFGKGKNQKETNAMRKGLGAAFGKFDAYQLAKYRAEGKAISLVDAVNLLHPRPSDKNMDALRLLVEGKLTNQNTWETKLSEAGKADTEDEKLELKGKAWSDLINENKLGYMALLKNLRNILEQADAKTIDKALETLADPERVKKSRVLPFRFYTAYKEMQKLNGTGSRKALVALNKALDAAAANVPKFPGETLVVLDVSGSMGGFPSEIGSLFSAIMVKAANADFMTFSDSARYQNLNPADSTLTIAQSINFNWGGTNFHSIFEKANKAYDRIIILSDMQGWMGYSTPTAALGRYKSRTGANPHVYSFDLAGHGTLQFPENRVYALAGFSEKIFDIMGKLEQDPRALVHEIEKVEL